jgi:hypothetical protein
MAFSFRFAETNSRLDRDFLFQKGILELVAARAQRNFHIVADLPAFVQDLYVY